MAQQQSYFLQLGPHDCALACLRMVLKHHGYTPPLSQLIHFFPVAFGGISLFDLENAFNNLGFDTATIKLDIPALVDSGHLPVILYLSENHFVVLFGKKGDKYMLGDPAIGQRTISKEELEHLWYLPSMHKGIALMMEPKDLNLKVLTHENPPGLSFVEFFKKKKKEIASIQYKRMVSIIFQVLAFTGAALSLYFACNFQYGRIGLLFLFVFFTTTGILSEILSQRAIRSINQVLQSQIQHEFSSRFLNNANILLDPWIQSWSIKSNWLIESFLQTAVKVQYLKIQQLIIFGMVVFGLFLMHFPSGFLVIGLATLLAIGIALLKYFGYTENMDYFEKSIKSYDLYRKIVANRFYVQMFNADRYFKQKWEEQELAAYRDRLSFWDKQAFHYLLNACLIVLLSGVALGIMSYWYMSGATDTAVFVTSIFLILIAGIPFYLLLRSERFIQQKSFIFSLEDYWELASAQNQETEKIGPFNQLTLAAEQWGLSIQIEKGDKVAVVTDNPHDRAQFFENLMTESVHLNFNKKSILRQDLISQLSYIDESAKIYEDSLKNNIVFGNHLPLEPILKAVNLQEEIKNQASGIETLIQTDYISPILKLKLLAARVISKQAPLTLINLDLKPAELPNEGEIIRHIINFLEDRTVLWFASNPTQIPKQTTKIIVFKNGEILEAGSPAQLAIIKGYFYRFNKNSNFGGNTL